MTMHAQTEADYSAEYRADHARLAREESDNAVAAKDELRKAQVNIHTLMFCQPHHLDRDKWNDVIDQIDALCMDLDALSDVCRERADELEHEPLNADGQ